jgi:hypothetical protein
MSSCNNGVCPCAYASCILGVCKNCVPNARHLNQKSCRDLFTLHVPVLLFLYVHVKAMRLLQCGKSSRLLGVAWHNESQAPAPPTGTIRNVFTMYSIQFTSSRECDSIHHCIGGYKDEKEIWRKWFTLITALCRLSACYTAVVDGAGISCSDSKMISVWRKRIV